MANKVNYLQIRKLDANGEFINLNLQDSIGDTLTFQEEGYSEKSSWKILTLQEFPTYFLLQVEEDNYPDNGSLNNLYNALFPGVTSALPTLNIVPFNEDLTVEAVTGEGEGAIVWAGCGNANPPLSGVGDMNIIRVIKQGIKYRAGDNIKFTIPAASPTNPSGADIEVTITLTDDMLDNSTNAIVDITNIPYYASFSAQTTQINALGPNADPILGGDYSIPSYLDPYANPGGAYANSGHLYQRLNFKDPKFEDENRSPQPLDGIFEIYPPNYGAGPFFGPSSSGYMFGITPQAPIEFTLDFKNISASDAGHFYFNMFQWSDKTGKENVFSGKLNSDNEVINNFRGFGLSQSINYSVGNALTGPIYIPTTVGGIDFKISGSIRAGEIQSGSIWVVGVSKDPNDYSVINPDIKWEQVTWSMQISPSAKAYQSNTYAASQIEAGYMLWPTWSNQDFDGSQTFGPEAYIDPNNNLWTTWWSNNWNPILGNFQESRENSFLMDIEYNHQTGSQVPSNRFQILSGSAQKANIPDSNYTQRRVIDPRYLGCRLQSADYNFYTEEGYLGQGSNFEFGLSYFLPRVKLNVSQAANNPVLEQFLNGDTCSIAPQYAYPTSSNATASKQWYGDISYGKNAVIDSYPKYIAHFQTSYDSYLKFGTRQFDLDALIEVPNEDVTDNQGYQAVPLPLDGDGEYQFDVAKTFEAGRDAGIFFNTFQTGGLDFSLIPGRKRRRKRRGRRRLSPKSGEIFDGGMKYTLMYTNEVGGAPPEEVPENIEYAPSYSYRKNRFRFKMEQMDSPAYRGGTVSTGEYTESIQMITGSTEYGIGDNFFMLSGSCFPKSQSSSDTYAEFSQMIHFTRLPRRRKFRSDNIIPDLPSPLFKNFYSLGGPQLATVHTHNYYLFNNIKARGIGETQVGRRRNLAFSPGVNSRRKRNYFKFLPHTSGCPGYEYDRVPFLIQPGDEIRVTAEVRTAGYENHTGSMKTGIDPHSYDVGTQYGYQLDSLVRSRNAGWGAYCQLSGSTDADVLGTRYYDLGTRTNGEGTGATFRLDICCGTLLPMDYVEGGWLGNIIDGYFFIGDDYMNDVTNAGAGLSNAGSPYNFVSATGGSGTEARFNITVDGTGVVTVCSCTVPGQNYKNGDVLTFDVADIGGVGTPPTITVGTEIGVGSKPNSKMAFYDPQINPSQTTGNGDLGNLQVGLTFKGETGLRDASCTEITLYRVGTQFKDGDYVVWDHERLRAYGAGLGDPVNGNIAGVTGSMQRYNDLVIRIPDGGVNTGPCNIFGMRPGTGYRAGDTVWIPKEYFSGSALGDVEINLSPLDLWYKDTTTVTRDFSFQVLAVSQSNTWQNGTIPDDTGVYLPYTQYPNMFGWMGLETTGGGNNYNGSILDTANSNWVDLLPYINGDLPDDNGPGPIYTGVGTTSVDAPNGSGGSGLVVALSASGPDPATNDGVITAIVPTAGGTGYSYGEVIEISTPVGPNIFITIPMEAIQVYDGDVIGNVDMVGQFGAPANKIFVHPNPKNELFGIEEGEIKRCTFRKRTPTDQAVVVEMDPPSGSLGAKTPSGDGYLIPADLSKVQRKNALSIINKLNAQNAFRKNRN